MKKKHAWRVGDVFLVPRKDGDHTVGQVIEHILPHVISIALFRTAPASAVHPCAPGPDEVFSVVTTDDYGLTTGRWKVVASGDIIIPRHLWPSNNVPPSLVGLRTFDHELIEVFVNAFHGLQAWDDWHDPHFLDELLLTPAMKPRHLVYIKRQPPTVPDPDL